MGDKQPLSKTELVYTVGKKYRDRGSPNKEGDQFLRWMNLPGSGMKNMGGVRWLKTKSKSRKGSDGIVLISSHLNTESHNPWDDIVDHHLGLIKYWGDAKFDEKKRIDDWIGNKNLRQAIDESNRKRHPFILHFTKEESGWMTFNGLCVMKSLDLAWFQDEGRPVQNYRATLSILDCNHISVKWLENWRTKETMAERLQNAPEAWIDYVHGRKISIMRAWSGKVKSTKEQLPPKNSVEEFALEQLMKMNPFDFERMTVQLIDDVGSGIIQDLEKTRDRQDGGYDFSGTFVLPEPFQYEIPFKGEIKRHRNAISPDHVSRLVARLSRGEYGIYITTSYFTKQAQSEVFEMRYPVSLVYANKLLAMFKQTSHWNDKGINQTWLNSFKSKEEE